jgi:hypothetical protein
MKKRHIWYTFGIALITSVTVFALSQKVLAAPPKPEEDEKMKISFKNIDDPRIETAFNEVFLAYDVLHDYPITLVQKKMKKTTMVAQPVVGFTSLFGGKKEYVIKLGYHVRDSDKLAIRNLPINVLKGWFAHELGHIVDYEKRSAFSMVGYGLRYSTSQSFKKDVEHEADSIAINHGFFKEIIATKKFILENELVSQDYKDRINRYYMPIEGVEMCVQENNLLKPTTN